MKKAKNIMRRLLAAGAAPVLLAGSLPQAVYAEEPVHIHVAEGRASGDATKLWISRTVQKCEGL